MQRKLKKQNWMKKKLKIQIKIFKNLFKKLKLQLVKIYQEKVEKSQISNISILKGGHHYDLALRDQINERKEVYDNYLKTYEKQIRFQENKNIQD